MNDAQAFWNWFKSAHSKLQSLGEVTDEALLDELLANLHSYSSGLWFEIGGQPDGPMELVISAEGDPDFLRRSSSLLIALRKYRDGSS